MGCLTVRWRKRLPAADQARFMGIHTQKNASSEKSILDQSPSAFYVAHAKRFSMWTSESRSLCLVGRYCSFASDNLRLMVFILTCSPFSASLALVLRNRWVGLRLNSATIILSSHWTLLTSVLPWQVIGGFCIPIPLYPHLHEVLRLFKQFGSNWVWKMWSACMGAEKTVS